MRMTGVATPFTSYTIPPNAPEPVAEAWRELNCIGQQYDQRRRELSDARKRDNFIVHVVS